jgi:hypothetical protein
VQSNAKSSPNIWNVLFELSAHISKESSAIAQLEHLLNMLWKGKWSILAAQMT